MVDIDQFGHRIWMLCQDIGFGNKFEWLNIFLGCIDYILSFMLL